MGITWYRVTWEKEFFHSFGKWAILMITLRICVEVVFGYFLHNQIKYRCFFRIYFIFNNILYFFSLLILQEINPDISWKNIKHSVEWKHLVQNNDRWYQSEQIIFAKLSILRNICGRDIQITLFAMILYSVVFLNSFIFSLCYLYTGSLLFFHIMFQSFTKFLSWK